MFCTIFADMSSPLIFNLLNEGGAFFMYSLLLMLLISLGILGYSFAKGDHDGKLLELLKSISLFALVFGFLGHMIGLISALDTIESMDGGIYTPMLAAGLKVGLLSPLFGTVIFLIVRLGIIFLIWKQKE